MNTEAPSNEARSFGVGAAMRSSDINNTREQGKGQSRPRFSWPKLRKAIEFYERERLCYLPAYWGHPYVKWEEYQTRLPTRAEKAEWFKEGKPTNIGVLCGGISGGHKLQQGRIG